MGDGRAEGSSVTGDERQDAVSLIAGYIEAMGSGSLPDSILSAILLLGMLGLK